MILPAHEQVRQKHRPAQVRMPFVGESRPANGTFFYLHDSILYSYTREAFERVYGKFANDEDFLAWFRKRGYYLVDLCQTPVNRLDKRERRAARRAAVDGLADVLRELQPERIVIVLKGIEDEVTAAVRTAGLQALPIDALPFPAQGNQRRYVEELAELVRHLDSESVNARNPVTHATRKIARADPSQESG